MCVIKTFLTDMAVAGNVKGILLLMQCHKMLSKFCKGFVETKVGGHGIVNDEQEEAGSQQIQGEVSLSVKCTLSTSGRLGMGEHP